MSTLVNLSSETVRHIEEARAKGVDVDTLISRTLTQALFLPNLHAAIDTLQAEAKRLENDPSAWRQAFEKREQWLRAHPLPALQDDSLSRESIYGDRL